MKRALLVCGVALLAAGCSGGKAGGPADLGADAGGDGGDCTCVLAHATTSCQSGSCMIARCDKGWADCDEKTENGCEVEVDDDSMNCGMCNFVCSSRRLSPTCLDGKCGGVCEDGWADCNDDKGLDGCETSLHTVGNCGACGTACVLPNATTKCGDGVCEIDQCHAGWADCDGKAENGCETSTATSATSCGACDHVCAAENGGPSCSGGMCSIECAAGFADCNHDVNDGCERQIAADAQNCGVCGTACSSSHVTPSCAGGVCNGACEFGWGDCNGNKQTDGCETFIAGSDNGNCGACGRGCSLPHASSSCSGGTCALGACASGWANCDGRAENGCETYLAGSDDNNCGACGRSCACGCSAGACIPMQRHSQVCFDPTKHTATCLACPGETCDPCGLLD